MIDPAYLSSDLPRNRIAWYFLWGKRPARLTPGAIQGCIEMIEEELERAETAGDVENTRRYAAALDRLRESKKKAEQGVDP